MRNRTASQRGFTLLELLTALSIIGVISAIAIPQYNVYKERSFSARAASDLRDAAMAEEALYADQTEYRSCIGVGCNDPVLPGFRISPGTVLEMEASLGNSQVDGTATHPQATHTYIYSSLQGTVEVL